MREMRVVRLMPMRSGSPVGATDPALAFGQRAHNFFALFLGYSSAKSFVSV